MRITILTKRVLPFIVVLIVQMTSVIALYSQAPCATDYTLTTDPDAPANKKFSLRPNFFRWVGEETFDIYSDVITNPNTIASPYYQDGNAVINIHNQFKNYKIEDGWELIQEDRGYMQETDKGDKVQAQRVMMTHGFR